MSIAGHRGQHERREAVRAEDHLIVVEDEEIVVEHHPEDWIAFVIFWSLAFIVFLQFFTRYVLNDSLAWTEEIARYGLMWIVFIGGAMVTRRNTHIAVELLSNVHEARAGARRAARARRLRQARLPRPARLLLLDITERMHIQRMTVFDLPMSYVYGGVALGCFLHVHPAGDQRLAQCARRLAQAARHHAPSLAAD